MSTDGCVRDAVGRPIALDPEPRRIISLVPSVTECLFDLGAGDRVVGRTAFCISPPEEVGRLPKVGGPKAVDHSAVLALRPDLVLANAEENAREQILALIAEGLRVHVAFPRTVEDAAGFLEDLGRLLRAEARSVALARELRSIAEKPAGQPVRAACLIWKGPYMTVNGDTLTSSILEASGGENVFVPSSSRYPVISVSDLASARPRVVLLPSEPYAFSKEDALELGSELPDAALEPVRGEWVTWYGSRMPEAIEGLRRLLDRYRK